jgi:protein-S-isoprenylcysteine O-methyltransferase Ste14
MTTVKRILRWTDLVACLVLLALAVRFGPHTRLWCVGLLLSAATLPLWVLARCQLGSAFSAMPEARSLVTHGLYSRLRHPIYVFGCLAYFGSLLALQVWPVLVAWLALTPIEVVRAKREDRVLAAAFGPAYAAYRRNTWL